MNFSDLLEFGFNTRMENLCVLENQDTFFKKNCASFSGLPKQMSELKIKKPYDSSNKQCSGF